jgi:hypothetical protein
MARHGAPVQRRIQDKSWWIRVLAALSICLLGAQGLLPSLHQSLVAHRICEEHGELVEAHDSHGGALEHAAEEPSALETAVRAAGESDHDEHCDCVLGTFVSGGAALQGDSVSLASPGVVALKLASADAVATAEILSYAPKLSPPL